MNASPLFKFMHERHSIYLRRKGGAPKPWTKDPILQQYRFCNVYRELDKVTVWINENIRERYDTSPNLWFMLCAARQINWPPTIKELMNENNGAWPGTMPWNPANMRSAMLRRKEAGEKVYTGAYMLNAHGKNDDPADKPFFTAYRVLLPLWEERDTLPAKLSVSIQQTTEVLSKYFGWGPFLAYEVACDLRWTRYLENAPDIMTWANAGPGAKRGLNRLAGRSLRKTVPVDTMLEEMRYLLRVINRKWPFIPLELREIEHSLCEFDKYERVRLGEGKPRASYPGA